MSSESSESSEMSYMHLYQVTYFNKLFFLCYSSSSVNGDTFKSLESDSSNLKFKRVRTFLLPSGKIKRSDQLELYKSQLEIKIKESLRSIKGYYRSLQITDLSEYELLIIKTSETLGAGTTFSSDFFVEYIQTNDEVPEEIYINKTQESKAKTKALKEYGGKRTLTPAHKEAITKAQKGIPKPKSNKGGRPKGGKSSRPHFQLNPKTRIVILDMQGEVQARHLRGMKGYVLKELKISLELFSKNRMTQRKLGLREYPMYADVVRWIPLWQNGRHSHKFGWRIYQLDDFIKITGINPYDDFSEDELKRSLKIRFPLHEDVIKHFSGLGREPQRKPTDKPLDLVYD